jgi:predicted membrane protein (TIGR00267 family)
MAKNKFLSQIRQIVFGMQDGLISILVLTTTLSSVSENNYLIVVAAISATFGGAISMAAGMYLGSKSQKEINVRQESKIQHQKDIEKILGNEGVSKKDANLISKEIKHYDKNSQKFLLSRLTGENITISSPMEDSIFIGISFILGAIIPLIPYFIFAKGEDTIFSILLTAITLIFIGITKANFAGKSKIHSAFEMLIIGALAGVLGFILGKII